MSYKVRPAVADDGEGIAQAHVDSIRSISATAYAKEIVNDWAGSRTGEDYRRRMREGELFFVAHDGADEKYILGFSSHRAEPDRHSITTYVRGDTARKGVSTALLAAAEDAARRHGAREIRIDASLVAVPFYKANGFEELGSGEHALKSGGKMSCIFMRKRL
jgi:putative acetyltransferase